MKLADTATRAAPADIANTWSVTQREGIVEVGFGSGADFPQYVALHTNSGFLRLNYGRDADWGTSIVLLPSFWEAGRYYQGAQISASWRVDVADLVISFTGRISGLRAVGEARLVPPMIDRILCIVRLTVDGSLILDRRSSEAFKPIVLSSMHVSPDKWDAQSVDVESGSFPIPAGGRIIWPPKIGSWFALKGGGSKWKRHAPSHKVELDRSLEITGWKTESSNPNDDNLAVWAATDQVLPHWEYVVISSAE